MKPNIRNPKGAGRKAIDKEARNICISIRFSEEEIKEIEKIAKELDIPKTKLIRNLALAGLSDAKLLNNLKILKGVKTLIDFKDRFSNPNKYKYETACICAV